MWIFFSGLPERLTEEEMVKPVFVQPQPPDAQDVLNNDRLIYTSRSDNVAIDSDFQPQVMKSRLENDIEVPNADMEVGKSPSPIVKTKLTTNLLRGPGSERHTKPELVN